jgi:lysophospholipase L1-like esterase
MTGSHVTKKITVFLAGFLVCLVLMEIALRIMGANFHNDLPVPSKGRSGAYTILCLGDSYTYGIGAPRDKSYPRQLEELLNCRVRDKRFRVINAGESTLNTAQILERLDVNLATIKPDLVVLLCGGANYWNCRGYYAFCHGRSWYSGVQDQLYRVRLFKLGKLLLQDLRLKTDRRAGRKAFDGTAARGKIVTAAESQQCKYLLNEGYRLKGIGKYREAIDRFKQAVALNPSSADIYCGLGYVYNLSEDTRQAVKAFEKSIELDANSAENTSFGYLASIYLRYPKDQGLRAEIRYFILRLRDSGIENPRIVDTLSVIENENDAYFTNVAAWIRHDTRAIVAACQRNKAKVIMLNYPNYRPGRQPIAQAGADAFVDNTLAFTELLQRHRREELFVPDGHCTATGYTIMARNIYEKMVDLGIIPGAGKLPSESDRSATLK